MCWVPSCLKHDNLPCNEEVAVEVIDVVADEDAVEVPDEVTVDVLGYVVTVLVTEVVAVVKSHFVYWPVCQSVIARFNAAAVAAHFL